MAVPDAGADRRLRPLVTPEGVNLHLRLGEASERAGAFLLDALFIVLGLAALTLVTIPAVLWTKGPAAEVALVIWILGAFLARNLYFIGFELSPRAATPGKRLMGLRVAARNGGRLTADAIFARNAMRELEVFLPLSFLAGGQEAVDAWIATFGIVWCGIFVFFPLFNRDRLRVGDLVAGTWVVKAPRPSLLPDLAARATLEEARFAFTPAQLDAYGIKELHVLEEVLRRQSAVTVQAVAERIRAKIGWARGAEETDAVFLDAYYSALRRRLEGRLLMGRRRRDKHDVA